MPALNWIAMENGIESDPKLLSFARLLKAKQETAFWYLYMWRVFVLQKGNHVTGTLPKKYTAQDLASFVGFKGEPRRFVNAMKTSGFVAFKKGCGFFYPGWRDTVTGAYAAHRQEDRDRKAKDRDGRMNRPSPTSAPRDPPGQLSEVPRNVRGKLLEIPPNFHLDQEERKEESEVVSPPNPPRAGGSFLAEERWQWLLENAPTPQNPERSKKYLGALPDTEWALVMRAYGRRLESRSSMSNKEIRDLRVLNWPTDKLLAEHAYLRFRIVERPKIRAPRPPGLSSFIAAEEELKRRLAASDEFVMELVRDPDQPKQAREAAMRRWAALPENANRTPPWEAPRPPIALNGVSP